MRHFLRSATVAIAMAAASTLTLSPAFSADISGAGATFPYPIYAKWADAYKKETGIGINYQSIGSGGGIKQIKAKTVTFGASDMPLKKADLDAAGLMQFPAVMGGVVPIINLDGIASGAITLDGPTMAKIFKGDITAWNDDAIKALNPGVELPSDAIAVVHRSDGSGTTFIFSDYLSKVSPEWKDAIGANTALEWPVGIGAKGNEGVANNVAQTKGAIGYVEYAYAKQNNMTVTKLVNAEGKAVAPAAENFQAAAAGADWKNSEAFDVVLTNEPGAEAWPISGATFILVYKKPDDAAATGEVLKFFDWAFAKGDDMAAELAYVPLPDDLVSLVKTTWGEQITDADGKPIHSGM